MKIAFITSSLEPGKDGVGDYTRLLAEECVRQGHECCLVSLNERLLTQIFKSKIVVDSVEIPLLRLPANISWNQRTAYAEKLLALFQPDWISLQFVPYGYQDKGIVINLSKWLRPLIRGRRLHIMFHELWIGQYVGAKLKEQLVGTAQKFFILRMVKQLQPTVVNTSNSTYIARLKQIGVSSSILPMYGNIPISEHNGANWLFLELQKLGLDIKKENRNQFWLFGFFGTLHSLWPPEPLFTYLHQAAIQHQRKVVIISIGRLGSGETLWKKLSKTYSYQFSFIQLGEQSSVKVSEFLNFIDFGIATSPNVVIGKSGTIAAMLEHGLPVIVNWLGNPISSNWGNRYSIPLYNSDSLLYQIDDNFQQTINNLRRVPSNSKLPSTTAQFLKSLMLNL